MIEVRQTNKYCDTKQMCSCTLNGYRVAIVVVAIDAEVSTSFNQSSSDPREQVHR